MIRSFFILGDDSIDIQRFHLCTWKLSRRNAFFELGFELNNRKEPKEYIYSNLNKVFNTLPCCCTKKKTSKTIQITIASAVFASVLSKDDIICLSDRLVHIENCKFIFNDIVTAWSEIEGDRRNGVNLSFVNRGNLTILPIEFLEFNKKDEYVTIEVEIPEGASENIYFRVLIKTQLTNLALIKKSISTTKHILDIRINESRNLPDKIHSLMKAKSLSQCKIKTFFCFHILLNTFKVSLTDDRKLNSVRMLEVDSFKQYLSKYVDNSIKEKRYLIYFNKHSNKTCSKQGCSFFTIFEKEDISRKSIILAFVINVICTLLLSLAGAADKLAAEGSPLSLKNFLVVFNLAQSIILFIVISFCIWWIVPWSRIYSYIKTKMNKIIKNKQ